MPLYRRLAIPPVAIVKVKKAQVKYRRRCLQITAPGATLLSSMAGVSIEYDRGQTSNYVDCPLIANLV